MAKLQRKTLSQYIKDLQLLEANYGNHIVVSASDSEWNSFSPVQYDPTVGKYDEYGTGVGDFSTEKKAKGIKAVCIN